MTLQIILMYVNIYFIWCNENDFDGVLLVLKNTKVLHNRIVIDNHHCNYKNSW